VEGGTSIYGGPTAERVHPTIKIITDIAGALCGQKRWKEVNGAGL